MDAFLDKVDSNDVTSPDAGVHQLVPLKDALQSFEIQVKQSLECLEDLVRIVIMVLDSLYESLFSFAFFSPFDVTAQR